MRLFTLLLLFTFCLPVQKARAQPLLSTARNLLVSKSSYFVDTNGNMWSWGKNNPIPRIAEQGIHSMALGTATFFIIKKDGTLWGKGDSSYGQLGYIQKEDIDHYIHLLSDVKSVEAVYQTVYAIKNDNTLWVWGKNNSFGKETIKKKPKKMLDKVAQVTAGPYHTVALREDGTLWSWGSNKCGRLGVTEDSNIFSRTNPGLVDLEPLEGRSIVKAIAQEKTTFIITEDGLVWHWGGGVDLARCEDFPPFGSSLELLPFIDNVKDIAINFSTSYFFALKKDGTLWVWGVQGRMGLPEKSWDNPRQILHEVEAIELRDNHALVLKKDGTIWAWGDNDYGQLGPDRASPDYTPRQVVIPYTNGTATGS